MDDNQEQSLSAITDDLIDPFDDLKEFTEDQMNALKAFGKSLRTIIWLKENVKGCIHYLSIKCIYCLA